MKDLVNLWGEGEGEILVSYCEVNSSLRANRIDFENFTKGHR